MLTKWVLDYRGRPVVCEDEDLWRNWHLNIEDRIVRRDIVDGHEIVTVFIGLDQASRRAQHPALWETEIRLRGEDLPSRRQSYRSRAEAETGHAQLVKELRR